MARMRYEIVQFILWLCRSAVIDTTHWQPFHYGHTSNVHIFCGQSFCDCIFIIPIIRIWLFFVQFVFYLYRAGVIAITHCQLSHYSHNSNVYIFCGHNTLWPECDKQIEKSILWLCGLSVIATTPYIFLIAILQMCIFLWSQRIMSGMSYVHCAIYFLAIVG